MNYRSAAHALAAILSLCMLSSAADQPQWGAAWTRNMVSEEKGLPSSFNPETGENIKWVVPLGGQTHSTPIVAGGRVYIGTSNSEPRDPTRVGDRGIFLCLDENDGRLLWQLVVPKRTEDDYFDWPKTGISSPATIEGERAYLVDNRGEVICLDVQGLANGNDGPFKDEGAHLTPHAALPPEFKPASVTTPSETNPLDADILWAFDMPAEAGVWPHDGAHSSILILGDYLYVNTGTGVDNSHRAIRTPDAPSLIVLEKATGRLVARDREQIAPIIFHSTWSSPALAKLDGRDLIVFAGGDGVVRAFEPVTKSPAPGEVLTLKKVWAYDIDPNAPKEEVHRFTNNKQQGPSDIYGMPVVLGTRMFVAGGGDLWWGKNEAWLKCIDLTKTKDLTHTGEIWSYPLDKHTMSTAAVWEGLVFVTDTSRNIHCLDAETGKPYWTHKMKGEVWASPMVADGKVYIGTRKGDFSILAASKEKQVLASVDFKDYISATTTAANGVIYIATMNNLFAIQQGAQLKSPKAVSSK
ncbi:MAG: secondary metabolism, biosynthesis of secondary products derived from primary amino acid [Chthoniobacteraceae bacterium]|nr:secondary metabolism, biosynthesis of secondary products derived from primary amino acid [Chthoniobacteraceae bacterium]